MSQPNPADKATPQPLAVPLAVPRAAARFAGTPRSNTGAAPDPAASLRRRLEGRRVTAAARWRSPRGRLVMNIGTVVFLAGAALLALVAGPTGVGVLLLAAADAAVVVWAQREALGLDAPSRELRRRISAETRTARSVEPLESAGWVLLHDRLVAHERVPHILLGPPGALVLFPHSFGRLTPLRARARRVLRVRRRPARHVVMPDQLGDDAALRGRDNLLQVLVAEPDMAGWVHVVRAVVPVLDRPADQVVLTATPVVHIPAGPELRRALEVELPAGLSRTAVAYLASIVDHACPPA